MTSGIGSLARGGFWVKGNLAVMLTRIIWKAQEKVAFHAFNMPLHSRRDGPRIGVEKKKKEV